MKRGMNLPFQARTTRPAGPTTCSSGPRRSPSSRRSCRWRTSSTPTWRNEVDAAACCTMLETQVMRQWEADKQTPDRKRNLLQRKVRSGLPSLCYWPAGLSCFPQPPIDPLQQIPLRIGPVQTREEGCIISRMHHVVTDECFEESTATGRWRLSQ